MKNNNLTTAIFYTCGTCNLNCKYCGIDKSPILKDIDNALGKSFADENYYFNQVKKYIPNGQLIRDETWGGEPFYHMERIHPLIHKLIEEYPYFSQMYSSTNFSYPGWDDKVFNLLNQFREYDYRDFTYELQLSIDGPEKINDAGRGKGTTAKCLANFDKLITRLKNGELPPNVTLNIALKATLDLNAIHNLNSRESLIEYFKFFEDNFLDKFPEGGIPRVNFFSARPNTAVPAPVTVADGKIFANICKLSREIEQEYPSPFKYYKNITIFEEDCQNVLTYKYAHHNCGTGDSMIGFLPDGMISTCHEGFTHFVEAYKEHAAKESKREERATILFDKFLNEQKLPFCVDEAGWEKHCEKMSYFNTEGTSARLTQMTAYIMALAEAGQIEEIFKKEDNALRAAIFIQSHTSFCIKDNYNQTGSYQLMPPGLFKLLLNGAMEYIENGEGMPLNYSYNDIMCGGYCNGCNNCC